MKLQASQICTTSGKVQCLIAHHVCYLREMKCQLKDSWRTTVLTTQNSCPFIAARSDQIRSGSLISPGEPLARVYFVAPSKEKKIQKIKLKIKVKLINKIMQKSVLWVSN